MLPCKTEFQYSINGALTEKTIGFLLWQEDTYMKTVGVEK